MNNFIKILQNGVIVADGGWGTQLQKLGLAPGACPEEWNMLYPEKVTSIPKSYIAAGARMVKTNSFGANALRLEHYGMKQQAYTLAKAAAEISREAAGTDIIVAGSIGPTGKMLMMGDVTENELIAAFTDTARGLADGGADVFLIETFSDLDEMECALQACKEWEKIPVICSAVFQKTADETFRTMMGASLEDFYGRATRYGVSVLGTNCGNGFADMVPIIRALREMDGVIPLMVLPNAGIPFVENGKIMYPETPESIRDTIRGFIAAGANIIGGCCGTTPEHIAVISDICSMPD